MSFSFFLSVLVSYFLHMPFSFFQHCCRTSFICLFLSALVPYLLYMPIHLFSLLYPSYTLYPLVISWNCPLRALTFYPFTPALTPKMCTINSHDLLLLSSSVSFNNVSTTHSCWSLYVTHKMPYPETSTSGHKLTTGHRGSNILWLPNDTHKRNTAVLCLFLYRRLRKDKETRYRILLVLCSFYTTYVRLDLH